MTGFRRTVYLLPADLEDDLVADLWQAGTLGVQSTPVADTADGAGPAGRHGTRVRVEAWFPAGSPAAPEELGDLAARWRERGIRTLGSELVPEADWLALWRRGARPIPVGDHLLLDPREPERSGDGAVPEAAAAGRHLLRLPARRAFGTGSHETTRLALGLLEEACAEGSHPPGRLPERVLDVGTGTGVLAFAALLFGVPRVVAFDRDPVAVAMARDNARLNGFGSDPTGPEASRLEASRPETSRPGAPLFFAGTAEALAVEAGERAVFDVVLINILPHLVADDLPRLLRAVAPAGAVVVAGMLAEEGSAVTHRFAELGFEPAAERREGAWVAWRFERAVS